MTINKRTFINPPLVSEIIALVLFVVNIFAPGVGTMIVAIICLNCKMLIVGLLQMVTAPLIIGWIWSILWGWELLKVSRRGKVNLPGEVDGLL